MFNKKWNLILFLCVISMIASFIWFLFEVTDPKTVVKGQTSDNINVILSIISSITSIAASIIAIKKSKKSIRKK